MEKHVSGLLIVIAVLSLLIGGLVGYNMAPTKVVTEIVTEIEYQNITVEKVVEVPAENILDKAVATFMQAVDDEEDEAGNDIEVLGDYYFSEVELIRVLDEYNISYDDEITTVDFSIKLRFDDGDVRLKVSYDVKVIFEEDEDSEVIVALN